MPRCRAVARCPPLRYVYRYLFTVGWLVFLVRCPVGYAPCNVAPVCSQLPLQFLLPRRLAWPFARVGLVSGSMP